METLASEKICNTELRKEVETLKKNLKSMHLESEIQLLNTNNAIKVIHRLHCDIVLCSIRFGTVITFMK